MVGYKIQRMNDGIVPKKLLFLIFLFLTITGSGCRLSYLFHAGAGQLRILHSAIPIEKALKDDTLDQEQRNHLNLIEKIKAFGEAELGLVKTKSYETCFLNSEENRIYTISASPKDRLRFITWWFPIVGKVPYLGYFDLERAISQKRALLDKDLDVHISVAEAYSTLGWFKDPVPMSLIRSPTVELVETLLHEMVHETLYIKSQGEFNEGLAVLIGQIGAIRFFEKEYGPHHSFAVKARQFLEDERLFASFLSSLIGKLEKLYDSSLSYEDKIENRQEIFTQSKAEFRGFKKRLHTDRFTNFDNAEWDNAYLLVSGLYHRHFPLLETVLRQKNGSVRELLSFYKRMAGENSGKDMIARTKAWLNKETGRF